MCAAGDDSQKRLIEVFFHPDQSLVRLKANRLKGIRAFSGREIDCQCAALAQQTAPMQVLLGMGDQGTQGQLAFLGWGGQPQPICLGIAGLPGK